MRALILPLIAIGSSHGLLLLGDVSKAPPQTMQPPPKRPIRKLTTLAIGCAAGVCAGFEMRESFYSLGHHHGLALIALSKVAHALSLVQYATVEAAENLGYEKKNKPNLVKRILFSCRTLRILCLAALAAAFFEIYHDFKPGGHHGTALLALAEFRETASIAAYNSRRGLVVFLQSPFAKVALGLGALYSASAELFRDTSVGIGAHHGVVILAAAYVSLRIYRLPCLHPHHCRAGCQKLCRSLSNFSRQVSHTQARNLRRRRGSEIGFRQRHLL